MATTRKTTSNRTPAKKTAATKRTAAKKTTAKRTTAKKTTAKKSPARKTPEKRTAAKKTAERSNPTESSGSAEQPTSGNGSSTGSATLRASDAARSAAEQLAGLTGRQPETVIGLERQDGGWRVELEVVESRRIPDSTDVLAIYAVDVDSDGELTGYHRVRRYIRGKGGDGEEGRR